jgi:hypothetical protein
LRLPLTVRVGFLRRFSLIFFFAAMQDIL